MVFSIAQTWVEMPSDHLKHKNHVVSSNGYNGILCSKINEDNPIIKQDISDISKSIAQKKGTV